MAKCQYTTKFYHPKQQKDIDFSCNETALDTAFCIFHDKEYHLAHPQNVITSFMEKLNRRTNENELYCIGYNFPSILLTNILIKNTYFTKSIFHESVRFSHCIFENVNFYQATFRGAVDFDDSVFQGKIHFSYAEFQNDIFLHRSRFKNAVDFSHTTFRHLPHFQGTMFHGQTDFSDATFEGLANFSDTFFETALFSRAIFHSGATFNDSRYKIAYFRNATFKHGVYFPRSLFQQADFVETTFQGEADFHDTTFKETADFVRSKFLNFASFKNVLFENPEKTIFDVDDLSNVSFVGADITRVRFGENIRWGGTDGYTITDDTRARENPEKANLNSILSIYRNLRENYEYRLRYDEAGKFFIKEMDLKREFKEI